MKIGSHLPSTVASPAPGPPPRWILKGPWGPGAEPAEAPSRGSAWASGGSGLGWARDGGGYGTVPGGTQHEVRAGGASLAALSPRAGFRTPRGAAQGPHPHRAGLRPHVRGGGGVPHKGQAEGALPRPPWRQSRAFPVAVEGRAGLPAPPWEVRCPFVLAGPPPSLVECLHWGQSPDSLPLLPGGCYTDTSSVAAPQLASRFRSCALP